MRAAFYDELEAVTADLVSMCELSASAMDRATTALMDSDLDIAESVIEKDEEVDRLQRAARRSARTTCSPGSNRWPPTCARSWRACG